MDNENMTSEEMLVLNDDQGNLYAIPRASLEQYRVAGEKKKNKLEAALGDDVAGFQMGNFYTMQDSARQYQSSRLVEAERDRQANLATAGRHEENTASGIPNGTPETRLSGRAFFGRFITVFRPQQTQFRPA